MARMISKRRFWVPVLLVLLVLSLGGLCLHSLFAQRYTQSADTAIAAGKAQLFQKSVSGVLAAHQTFQGAYAEYNSATVEEKIKIRVYLALTRMLDLFVRNDGAGIDTLAELLAEYGVTRTGDAFEGMKFLLPLNDDKKVILPAAAPASAEELRSFFAGPFLTAVNNSIADLDAAIALCPATEGIDREIISKALLNPDNPTDPNQSDVEMDAGDYLLFRAVLKFMKTYALMCAGYNADVSIREIVALANLDVKQQSFKILTDRYPDFLKIRDAAKLNEARTTLIGAIDDYALASAKIRSDNDTQAGAEELFSIDITELAEEAFAREQMALVKNSLQSNTSVTLGGAEEWWNFQILTPASQTITAEFEDRFSSGGSYNCDTKFGCNARLQYALINGSNVTLRFNYYSPYYGWSEFTGIFNSDRTQITNGTYMGYNGLSGSYSGTFSANRFYVKSKTERTNLFPLFGDGSTPPNAIRDLLPQLNDYGAPLPGTMGHGIGDDPTLGGMLPDFNTQDVWIREMDGIFMPTGLLTIPQVLDGALSVNGNADDWAAAGIAPILVDVTGEKGQYMAANGDLQQVYVARDSQYLYVRMDLAGDVTGSSVWQPIMYGLRFRQSPGNGPDKAGDVKIFARNRSSAWEVKVQTIQSNGWYGPLTDLAAQGASAFAAGKLLEWRVSLSALGQTAGRFLAADTDAWSYDPNNPTGWEYWYSYDQNPTCLQIQPAASVTGNLNVPEYNGTGAVRIGVFEYSPNFSTDPAKRVGSQAIFPDGSGQLPSTYTIADLPVGKKVFVFLFWDRDGNGVVSPGDYTNFYQPLTTVAGVNGLNVAADDAHPDYQPPQFLMASIFHERSQSGIWDVLMAASLTGPSPEDVTVTVSGPGGEYTLIPGAWIRNKWGLIYKLNPSWLPDGLYTFTAVDSQGRRAEKTFQYTARYDLPAITALSPANLSYTGTATPTLSWTPPAGGPYLYQLWVVDYSQGGNGIVWYISDLTFATSLTVPAGILLPNSPYAWYVRLYENTARPTNFTLSPVAVLYTGASAASPTLSLLQIGARPPTGSNTNYSWWVDANITGVAPWEVTAWRVKKGAATLASGSGGPFVTRTSDSFYEASFTTPTVPVSGNDYALEMEINHSGTPSMLTQTGITLTYQGSQAVDLTSLAPAGNYYFKTADPSFSWNKIGDPNAYYRLRIYEPLGRIPIWSSAWSRESSAAVPLGVLKPGETYYWTVMTAPAVSPNYVSVYVNTEGNASNRAMYRFTLQPPLKGDVSGNGEVGLEDALLALQVLSGLSPAAASTGDVDGDNRVGLPEVLYILQGVSGLR
jgi:hypothetical protein